MTESYYKLCRELDICNELIEKYFNTQQYEKCFEGHLALAEQGYPLAECQIGYFYYNGLGVEKDLEKVKEMDTYVISHFRIAFGNRIMKQLNTFSPVYVACGGKEIEAIDYFIAKKILFSKYISNGIDKNMPSW